MANRNRVVVDSDDMITENGGRDNMARWSFLLLATALVMGIPTFLAFSLGSHADSSTWRFVLTGGGLWFGIFLMMKLFPHFWVTVPQTSAFVTTTQIGGGGTNPNIPYGPGGHPAFPWEAREESGNITLDIFTLHFEETVPTQDSAVIAKGAVQFKFSIKHLTKVIGLDASTLEGLREKVKQTISQELSKRTGEKAKNHVQELQKTLVGIYEAPAQGEQPVEGNQAAELLDEYGIYVTGFQISSIDFPQNVQEARDARAIGRELSQAVLENLGYKTMEDLQTALKKGEISEKRVSEAESNVLVQAGKGKLNVNRLQVSGLEKSDEAGKITGAILGQGGNK